MYQVLSQQPEKFHTPCTVESMTGPLLFPCFPGSARTQPWTRQGGGLLCRKEVGVRGVQSRAPILHYIRSEEEKKKFVRSDINISDVNIYTWTLIMAINHPTTFTVPDCARTLLCWKEREKKIFTEEKPTEENRLPPPPSSPPLPPPSTSSPLPFFFSRRLNLATQRRSRAVEKLMCVWDS